MMPYRVTKFCTFTIRHIFHRTSSCVHTLTNHMCIWLWAVNNNSVWLLFPQIPFPTNTTHRHHRHMPLRLQNSQELAALTCVGWHQHGQPSAEKAQQCAKMTAAVTGQKTCILRTDEKYDAIWHHWAGKGLAFTTASQSHRTVGKTGPSQGSS